MTWTIYYGFYYDEVYYLLSNMVCSLKKSPLINPEYRKKNMELISQKMSMDEIKKKLKSIRDSFGEIEYEPEEYVTMSDGKKYLDIRTSKKQYKYGTLKSQFDACDDFLNIFDGCIVYKFKHPLSSYIYEVDGSFMNALAYTIMNMNNNSIEWYTCKKKIENYHFDSDEENKIYSYLCLENNMFTLYDFKKIKNNFLSHYGKELVEWQFHPKNQHKWKEWGF
jgi:hypothetical protein